MNYTLGNINYDRRQKKYIIRVDCIHYPKGYKFFYNDTEEGLKRFIAKQVEKLKEYNYEK